MTLVLKAAWFLSLNALCKEFLRLVFYLFLSLKSSTRGPVDTALSLIVHTARRTTLVLLAMMLNALPLQVSIAADDIPALLIQARDGEATAQERLGWLYQTGRGVEQDLSEAVRWYALAAEQGQFDAQNNLGLIYQFGFDEHSPNIDEAARWFKSAADRGHSHAMYNLGVLHRTGDGVPLNYDESSRLFRQSARQGFIPAQTAIAEALLEGRGIKIDKVEALKWAIVASDALDQTAHEIRRTLERTLRPEQILEAERRASRFAQFQR